MAAGNEWINGYLEAILDTGEKAIGDKQHVGLNDFKAAKYFVESVTGFDESSLYRTWIKVRLPLNFVPGLHPLGDSVGLL